MTRYRVRLLFEPRDLWVGLYWTHRRAFGDDGSLLQRWLDVYVCLLPMFPLKVSVEWHRLAQRQGTTPRQEEP